MRSSLFINSKAPYSSQATKESLDAALASAAFGVQVGLLFVGDGVFQLKASQQPDARWLKRTAPIFAALDLYEISDVYVCSDDLSLRGLTTGDLMIPAEAVTATELPELFNRYDNLLTF